MSRGKSVHNTRSQFICACMLCVSRNSSRGIGLSYGEYGKDINHKCGQCILARWACSLRSPNEFSELGYF